MCNVDTEIPARLLYRGAYPFFIYLPDSKFDLSYPKPGQKTIDRSEIKPRIGLKKPLVKSACKNREEYDIIYNDRDFIRKSNEQNRN